MIEIKTIVATTLPDQKNEKYTKNLLRKFSDQVNFQLRQLPVKRSTKEVGFVKSAIIHPGKLELVLEVNPDLIDKQWEYYFIPVTKNEEFERQGKFRVIKKAKIDHIAMVKYPTDISLKPYRFEVTFKEGKDYFVKHYSEVPEELIEKCSKEKLPLYVYYPESLHADIIEADAEKRGLLKDGQKISPIEVCSWNGTFAQFKQYIISQWTINKN